MLPSGREQSAIPRLSLEEATDLATTHYNFSGSVKPLASYIDQNFHCVADANSQRRGEWVLKIANADDALGQLDFQNQVLKRLHERQPGLAPTVASSMDGNEIESITHNGRQHSMRLLSFVQGPLLASVTPQLETWQSLGTLLGQVARALEGFTHPCSHFQLRWDLAQSPWTVGATAAIASPTRRALLERAQVQFLAHVHRQRSRLPQQVIYNDANDHNVVVDNCDATPRVSGLFDFGDAITTHRIFDLAIAAAYAVFDSDDPLPILEALVRGASEVIELEDVELSCLLPAAQMRLVTSVLISHHDSAHAPDNEYIRISEERAWRALESLTALKPTEVYRALRACTRLDHSSSPDRHAAQSSEIPTSTLLESRHQLLGSALSLSYSEPLHIVKGRAQYLFDNDGRAYLDGVNNIAHVGHCHPKVVAAGQRQMAQLNTNTRYLHEHIVHYAKRLTQLFPDPFEVCTFVNSGSEANELALRMARAVSGRPAVLAQESGYHGNTNTLIAVSHYKHAGRGGSGTPQGIYTVPCPDAVRGKHRGDDAATRYVEEVETTLATAEQAGQPIGAFIAEPIVGCGGQVMPPQGYLRDAFNAVRNAGGVSIVDEVQVGFGRTGAQWWSFVAQDALPDIITVGKPMGNGHPLAAVVTTRAIAEAFDTGMEFFSSFGGNPVSCAIGLAVLDVLEEEELPRAAEQKGDVLLARFRALQQKHAAISDVRGAGLYLGIELMLPDPTTGLASELPATALARDVIDRARQSGVLLSSDGPHANVLKIKPPMVITSEDIELLCSVLDRALSCAES